jgi:hypothetical protein
MRRLIHSLGRWRGTHCNTCGRRITDKQTAYAGPGNTRHIHFNPDHCQRRAGTHPASRRELAARIAMAATAILTLAATAVLLLDPNRSHHRPELIAFAATAAAFSAAQIIERRQHIRRLIEHDPALRETTRKDSER